MPAVKGSSAFVGCRARWDVEDKPVAIALDVDSAGRSMLLRRCRAPHTQGDSPVINSRFDCLAAKRSLLSFPLDPWPALYDGQPDLAVIKTLRGGHADSPGGRVDADVEVLDVLQMAPMSMPRTVGRR